MARVDAFLEELFAESPDGDLRLDSVVSEQSSLRVTFSSGRLGEVALRLAPAGSCVPCYARIPGFDVVTLREPPAGLEAAADECIHRVLSTIAAAGFEPTAEEWRDSFGAPDDRFVFGDVAEVKITHACDQRCVFCKSPPNVANLVDVDEALEVVERLADRARLLTLSGGEPTLSARLAEVVRRASRAGFAEIEIQSNGMNLEDPRLVEELVEAGAGIALVSLHAGDADLSDALTATPGGFERTLRGIDRCLEAGMSVSLCHVICRGNVHALPLFGSFVRRRFEGRRLHVAFTLSLPNYRVRSNPGLMPPLTQVAPALSETLASFEPARGTSGGAGGRHVASVMHGCGLPLCVLGELAVYHDEYHEPSSTDPTEERVHLAQCGECSFRDRCSGLWRTYLSLYGDAGISPVS
jgi:MoaA/NifB/PqqE/SkfB family radical SAM enzyme